MIKRTDGSVTIYMMIILSALFLFYAVLADYARIWVADHRTETALQSAVRSGLSYTDADLRKYGLFAMADAAKNENIIKETVKSQLTAAPGESSPLLQLTSMQTMVRTDPGHALSNHDVWKRQVLEDMKYAAPIEFSLEVIDKFQKTDARDNMQRATNFYRQTEKLEKMRKQREEKLDQAWTKLKQWIGEAGTLTEKHRFYSGRLQKLNELGSRIGIHRAEEVTLRIRELEEQLRYLEEDLEDLEDRIDDLRERIARASGGPGQPGGNVSGWKRRLNDLREERSKLKEERKKKKEEKKKWEDLLKDIVLFHALIRETDILLNEDAREITDQKNALQQDWDKAKKINDDMDKHLNRLASRGRREQQKITKMKEQLLIDASYFQDGDSETGGIVGMFNGFRSRFDPASFRTGHDFTLKYQALSDANDSVMQRASAFYAQRSAVETARQKRNREIENQEKETVSKIQKKLDRLKDLLYECSGNQAHLYAKLKKAEDKYIGLNTVNRTAPEEVSTPDIENADEIAGQSMKLLERLRNVLTAVRDDAYINEYILYYFNYRTYGKNGKPPETLAAPSQPRQHRLVMQEAEYILYGLPSCQANQIAAFSEMFAVRMGIRTMESLLDPKSAAKAATPWLVFLTAALEGAAKALDDMQDLVNGEEVELSARLPDRLTLDYKDYLRLFLLIHGTELHKFSRMQALVELNTGKKLEKKYTYVEAETTAALNLWFVPGPDRQIRKQASWFY